MNELADNLYAQVLTMSGSAFSQWATNSDISTALSEKLANQIGCGHNSTELKQCLKTKNVSEFHEILRPLVSEYANLLMLKSKVDQSF